MLYKSESSQNLVRIHTYSTLNDCTNKGIEFILIFKKYEEESICLQKTFFADVLLQASTPSEHSPALLSHWLYVITIVISGTFHTVGLICRAYLKGISSFPSSCFGNIHYTIVISCE